MLLSTPKTTITNITITTSMTPSCKTRTPWSTTQVLVAVQGYTAKATPRLRRPLRVGLFRPFTPKTWAFHPPPTHPPSLHLISLQARRDRTAHPRQLIRTLSRMPRQEMLASP